MSDAIVFWYRNYKGDEGYRRVRPISIRFGTSDWHKEPQWLMLADDTTNDNKRREFAMRDISGVVGSPVIQAALIPDEALAPPNSPSPTPPDRSE